jgi:SAM-dependent methyltransferase
MVKKVSGDKGMSVAGGEPPGMPQRDPASPSVAGEQGGPVAPLATRALAADDPTGWFEPLYAAAAQGRATVPWDRGMPHWLLQDWAERQNLAGAGRRALVVGCGLGNDAEFIAGRGLLTTAFDIAPSAIEGARARFPGSPVDYRVADLFDLPDDWRAAFDLVLESQTIQALPDPPRRSAIARIAELVAPGGTLLVIAMARAETDHPGERPPWPITRREIDSFATAGLQAVRIDMVGDGGRTPPGPRWIAEFTAPADRG